MLLHDPDCNCRACRREERELNKAMGTDRSYIQGRLLNQDEKDKLQADKTAKRVAEGRRQFDYYV